MLSNKRIKSILAIAAGCKPEQIIIISKKVCRPEYMPYLMVVCTIDDIKHTYTDYIDIKTETLL